ncbi:MAG: site-specific DNA-methyltransferase [Candidatus Poribacteria bacterium]|nr:site-specific DNA-methyltransferase [Candidatus Poribacteria bacterium]
MENTRKTNSESQKRGTRTSAFGTAGRINHDASEFYGSKLYTDQEPPEPKTWVETPIPEEQLDQLYCTSSEQMSEIPDGSIHLMVTSPPYNAKKEYDDDLSLTEYRELLYTVFAETYRKLVTGGRACINIANLGRKPYIPLHSFIIEDMLKIGYYMRGEIIWDKGRSAGSSTAWGSWSSAANPVLRDVHEYILVFSKDSFSRKSEGKENSIRKEDFLEWTKSVWTFPAVSAKRIGHPAPFPEELPHRLIQLYTFKEDVVLDPFCGSGTTCLSAVKSQRHYIGYDIEEKYIELANERISIYANQLRLPI